MRPSPSEQVLLNAQWAQCAQCSVMTLEGAVCAMYCNDDGGRSVRNVL